MAEHISFKCVVWIRCQLRMTGYPNSELKKIHMNPTGSSSINVYQCRKLPRWCGSRGMTKEQVYSNVMFGLVFTSGRWAIHIQNWRSSEDIGSSGSSFSNVYQRSNNVDSVVRATRWQNMFYSNVMFELAFRTTLSSLTIGGHPKRSYMSRRRAHLSMQPLMPMV